VERDLWRPGHRNGHPGSDPSPLDDDQHQGKLLQAQGKGQGRADPGDRNRAVMNKGVSFFDDKKGSKLDVG